MESLKIQILSLTPHKTRATPTDTASNPELPVNGLLGFQTLLQVLMAGDTGKQMLAEGALPAGISHEEAEAAVCCVGEPASPAAAGIVVAATSNTLETATDATSALPHVAAGNPRAPTVPDAAEGKRGRAAASGTGFPDFHDQLREQAGHDAQDKPAPTTTSHHAHSLTAPIATTNPSRALEAIAEHRDPAVANVPVPQFTHGMAPAHPTHPAHTDNLLSAASIRIDTPIGTPEWHTEFAQKIVWLAGEKQQVAELHVNPPDLGPLHIRLVTDEAQASAVFASSHSEVREAVEMALPRLREVLAESGITLGNASVTADSPRDGSAFDRPRSAAEPFAGDADTDAPVPAPPPSLIRSRGNGLVDLFA